MPAVAHSSRSAPPLLRPLEERILHGLTAPPAGRDVESLQRWAVWLDRYVSLFSPEVTGAGHVPKRGAALVVGNHSLYWTADVWLAARTIFERRGIDAPLTGLTYDLLFGVPWLGGQLRRWGAVPAAAGAAAAALHRGELVMVYPGGDLDACRAWRDRDRVELGGRTGFVRLALRTGVPVVPVVSRGGQHAVVILARGDRIARALRLTALRVHVFPILAGLPFGVQPILLPPPPLPAAVQVAFLPPIDWSRYGPAAAEDPSVVRACYAEVRDRMQVAMDRLAARQPHPVATGVAHLARRLWPV